jgi:FtsP/CotA-like multicopper oxidase with cupredoxin domain
VPDVTQPVVPVGGTYTYAFTAEPAAAYVYHSHHHTAVQEPTGLYGVLVIDPQPGRALAQRDAQYARDYLQVVSEVGGAWVFHCHILSHVANQGAEPGGMITVLKVS